MNSQADPPATSDTPVQNPAVGAGPAERPGGPGPAGTRVWGRRLGGLFLILALADVALRQTALTFAAAACVVGMFGLIVVETVRTGVARTRWFDVRREEQPLGFWLFVVAMLLGAAATAAALMAIGAARRARVA